MDPNGQSGTQIISAGICTKCTFLSAHFRLVFSDGREATPKDGIYIHHMTSSLTPKKSNNPIGGGISLSSPGGAYFIDRGEDSGQTDTIFTSKDGTFNSGYHVDGAPTIRISYDIVNYNKTRPATVHTEFEYEYVDGIVGTDAGHTLKSVTIPKTNGKSQSQAMRISRDTTVMWARGHLHAGGVSMTMKVNGAQKCVSKPTYNAAGVITDMSICPEPIKLKAGESMVIESYYDTTKHKLREASDGHGAAHSKVGGSDIMGMFAMSYTT